MKIVKSSRHASALVAGAAVLLLGATQADAHGKVVSVVPAAESTVATPQLIQVRFNEAVEVRLSKLSLASSDGAAVSTMSMNDAKDPATLSIMPNAALKPGVYTATWSAVTNDGHKQNGTFKFTVK